MVEFFDPRCTSLTDEEILSFFRLINAPDQTEWDYEEPEDAASGQAQSDLVQGFRANFLPNPHNFALWAKERGQIVGMAGINRFESPAKAHCAEFGIGVAHSHQRQGIGYRLAMGIIERARAVGIKRLEADCLAENVAVARLLQKVGFVEEGLRAGAIQKQGVRRDVRLWGLIL